MAIIRYMVEAKAIGVDEDTIASGWQYEEVTNPHHSGKILTREKALEKIEQDGLALVHHCQHGDVWDSPDEPMLQKYEGTFTHFKF